MRHAISALTGVSTFCVHTLLAQLADEINAAVHSVTGNETSSLGNVIHALMNDDGVMMNFFPPPSTDRHHYRAVAKPSSISGFLSSSRSNE